MENLDPPQIKDGKMARFCPSRGFILDLGGDGGLLVRSPFASIRRGRERRRTSENQAKQGKEDYN